MNDTLSQPMKRKLLGLLGLFPWLPSRSAVQPKDPGDLAYKFRGISGVVIRTDAIGEKRFITIVSYTNRRIEAPALLSPKKNDILSFSGGVLPVPKTVRVTWREGAVSMVTKGLDPWTGGTIVGDYTIEVASRIPDAVIESLRKNPKGNLRIKFRLHSEGVYLGWEIERRPDYDPTKTRSPEGLHIFYPPGYELVGGDFKEARPAYYLWTPESGFKELPTDSPFSPEGKQYLDTGLFFVPSGDSRAEILWEKGWYIDKDGRKVLTDY